MSLAPSTAQSTSEHTAVTFVSADEPKAALSAQDRVAYENAFKEYLKLQPSPPVVRSSGDGDTVRDSIRYENDMTPLIDINASM